MNRKILKIATLFLLIVACMGIFSNMSFADDPPSDNKKWSVSNFDGFDSIAGFDMDKQTITTSTKNIMGTIINTIRIVGTGVAIIMIIYVAIKYMSAAPTEKAEFKKSATAYIVGAVVLFAASNILSVINNFATANIK